MRTASFFRASPTCSPNCISRLMKRAAQMAEIYIPAHCLADARRVLAAQDPEVSQLAQHWPARIWRAAIKVAAAERSEEHTSELQSIMRISYADFCLEKKQIPRSQTDNY